MTDIKISVIAPMYNEEAAIELYLEKTIEILNQNFSNYELILIDDGSTDHTVSRCISYIQNNKNIRLISFSRNYGHEIASTAGLDHAVGDFVVLMDTDLQHPPELIPEMVKRRKRGLMWFARHGIIENTNRGLKKPQLVYFTGCPEK